MQLAEYLVNRGESQTDFARRAGVSQQVVSKVCAGGTCLVTTGKKIIEATGGVVGLDDLQPEAAA